MAYVNGSALADKIIERPLPLDEALAVAVQIAEGLQEAHEHGVVHRDVKPANVMLDRKGRVKILDFGLAAVADRTRLTKEGTTLGTPAYMSPEQAQGGTIDRRTDVWALGVILYEMLTLPNPGICTRSPFWREPPIAARVASRASLACFLLRPAPFAIFSTRSAFPAIFFSLGRGSLGRGYTENQDK